MDEWTDKNGDLYRLIPDSNPPAYELVKKAKKASSRKKKAGADE